MRRRGGLTAAIFMTGRYRTITKRQVIGTLISTILSICCAPIIAGILVVFYLYSGTPIWYIAVILVPMLIFLIIAPLFRLIRMAMILIALKNGSRNRTARAAFVPAAAVVTTTPAVPAVSQYPASTAVPAVNADFANWNAGAPPPPQQHYSTWGALPPPQQHQQQYSAWGGAPPHAPHAPPLPEQSYNESQPQAYSSAGPVALPDLPHDK